MNILFINYGDRFSNSLNHIAAFVTELTRLGHACIIALPSRESGPVKGMLNYVELLARPACFPDGRTAHIIHAWTPREPVRRCLLAYQRKVLRPARLVIHLEDNERHILSTYTGRTFAELASLSETALGSLPIGMLAHPRHHQLLLYAADAATCITPRLVEFVPAGTR